MFDDPTLTKPLWDALMDALGPRFLSSPAFILSAVIAGVYVPGIVFSLVDVFVSKRLTVREALAVHNRAMKVYAPTYVVAMVVLALVELPAGLQLTLPARTPTLAELLRDLLLYFLVGDVASYAWHRLEHAHGVYARKVHYVHHTDRPPLSIWTAMVVHPIEGVTVFACFHLYGLVAPIHPLTFALAAFSLTAVTMVTHCGYRLPGYDLLFATSRGHDLHHSQREPVNVSVVLTLCDRLCGTYRRPAVTDVTAGVSVVTDASVGQG